MWYAASSARDPVVRTVRLLTQREVATIAYTGHNKDLETKSLCIDPPVSLTVFVLFPSARHSAKCAIPRSSLSPRDLSHHGS
jgi:hypothetical protein